MKTVEQFEECPKCKQTILRSKPDGTKVCCNRHCQHEWKLTTKGK